MAKMKTAVGKVFKIMIPSGYEEASNAGSINQNNKKTLNQKEKNYGTKQGLQIKEAM